MSEPEEVPDADRQEQELPAEPDVDETPPRITADPEAPDADALDQAIPAPLPDVDDFGG